MSEKKCVYYDMEWSGRDPTCFAGYLHCPNNSSCEGYTAPPVITNADRIRRMSDEELIDLMVKIKSGGTYPMCRGCNQDYLCARDCKKRGVEWLNQPYTEESK